MVRRALAMTAIGCAGIVLLSIPARPAAAAAIMTTTTTTTNVGLNCRFGPQFDFVEAIALTTTVPTAVAPGAPVSVSLTAAHFFETPPPYSGVIDFAVHLRARSATPGNAALQGARQRFSPGDPDPMHGVVMAKDFTARSTGPSVEFDFTEFEYTVTPDDFSPFTVVCKPPAPVSIALSTLSGSSSSGPASIVAAGQVGACRRVKGVLQSCTQFSVRSSSTKTGALRGRVTVECDRSVVVKFTSQHITSFDVSGGVATIDASGRLADRSDATATITATDGATYDRISIKVRTGSRLVCTANGRVPDGTVVLKS